MLHPDAASSRRRDAPRYLAGLAMVMLAAALWATVGVASTFVPQGSAVPLEVYGFVRTAVAGPILLSCAMIAGGTAALRPKAGSLPLFLLFGVCCALFQIGLFRSFALLGVTITVFLTVCLPPVFAVVWTMLRSGARVSPCLGAAMAMAVVGMLSFSTSVSGGNGLRDVLPGLAFAVVASVAFVVMTHVARDLSAGHPVLLVAGLGLTVTSVVLVPVALVLAPMGPSALVAALDWRGAGVLLYLGLVPTALAYVCYCAGMARCRSAVAGLVASMIEPAIAAGLAFVILREQLGPMEISGCLLLVLAMLTLWLDGRADERRALAA